MTHQEFKFKITSIEDSLTNYSRSLTKNNEDAKDLLQETYLKALLNKDKFDPSTNIKAWTYVIMKNIFINSYRKAQRQNMFIDSTHDHYHINSQYSNYSISPEYEYENKEIMGKINQLENNQPSLLTMNLEGYKYKEIAEKMNIPIGTVKSRIFLSRKKIMENFKEYSN